VTTGAVVVTPLSRALVLRLSGATLVWHRPVAVLVTCDGRTTRLPIHDTTRLAQSALIGASLLLAVVGRGLASKRKERTP